MRLLLVEDEWDLAAMVARGLRRSGYAVDLAEDGEEALVMFDVNAYDLVILDLNLPKLDGMEVLREIRRRNDRAKVLILSARSRIEERVLGLDSGACDYMVKPFDFIELEARVRALIRRDFIQKDSILRCGALALDMAAGKVEVGDCALGLTRKEFAILEYLMQNCGAVISAERLIEHVWDGEADPFSNSLKYHIYCLKKKLDQAGAAARIENIRGRGYLIRGDEEEETAPQADRNCAGRGDLG